MQRACIPTITIINLITPMHYPSLSHQEQKKSIAHPHYTQTEVTATTQPISRSWKKAHLHSHASPVISAALTGGTASLPVWSVESSSPSYDGDTGADGAGLESPRRLSLSNVPSRCFR